jgi:uncharacterized protein (DUF58 family)
MRKLSLGLIIIYLSTILSGCLTTAAIITSAGVGAGTVAYVNGLYSRNVSADLTQAKNAAVAAVKNDKLVFLKQKATGDDEYTVRASAPDSSSVLSSDENVEITIQKLTDNASKISIRYGTFGDEKASRKLMKQIIQRI